MANGLRKLIKKARKQLVDSSQGIRRNRFGPRFRVEELEERIAPAVTANSATDNADHTFTINADDEYISFTDSGGETWEIGVEWTGRTTGDILVTMDASEESITAIDIGNTAACDGTINLNIGGDADGLNGATLSLGTITDTNTNTATLNIFGSDDTDIATAVGGSSNNTISDGISATTITLDGSGLTVFNLGSITGLTTKTVATSMRVGAVGATGITASTSFVGTLTVTGSLAGPVSSALTLGATTLEAGSTAAGDITVATGNIGAVTLGDAGNDDTLTFAGDIISTAGLITSITGTDETSITISGAVTAGTSVGAIGTQIQTISGAITAGTSVGTVTVLTDLSGAISAGTTVGNVTAGNDISGNITGGTNVGDVEATAGDISSDVEATAGTLGDVTAGDAITSAASFTSGTTMGTLTADNDFAGDVTAGTTLAGIVSTDGSITSDAVITAGGTIAQVDVDSNETSGGNVAGTITTTSGNITTIDVGGNITAAITSAGSIGAITSDGSLSAAITAATGFTGAIQIDDGIAAGGSLVATTGGFAGAADIQIDTGGMAGAITATAGGIAADITVTAGGISGTVTATAGNISGAIAITAGDLSGDIEATAGSIGDITLSDGNITAASSITAGTSIGTITADDDFAGDVTAATTIAGIVSTDGSITADSVITAGGTITAVTVDSNETSGGAIAGTITTTGTGDDITTIDAGGNISGTITAAGQIGAITTDGELSGDITAGEGFTGAIQIDDGVTAAGSLVATTGGIAGAITIDTGGMAGAITATAGDIGGLITVTAGGISGTVTATAADITGGVTITAGGLSGTIVATAGDISTTGVLVTAGGITSTGQILAGGDISTTVVITAGGLAGTISGGTDGVGSITGAITVTDGGVANTAVISAGTNVSGAITVTDDDFAGDVTATTGNIGNLTMTAGNDGNITSEASFTAGGTIGTLTADVDFAADVTAGGGGITGIVSADGDITADSTIVAAGTIGQLTADADETASGIIAATVSTTAGNITTINAGSNITGTITAFAQIGTITTDGELSGDITAGTGITGAVQIDDGITATGSLMATTGDIDGAITIDTGGVAGLIKADANDIDGAITITAGGLTGTIEAGVDIDGAITITAGGLSGTVKAGTNVDGLVTVTAGGLTGTVQASTGNIGGGITVTAGGIDAAATITAGADVDGNITATTGDIAADITAATNIDGNIVATAGAISGIITAQAGGGTITGDITAGSGNITSIVAGGTINGSTIRAEDDITSITAAGDLSATITASYNDIDGTGDIGTVTSSGEVTVTMAAINIGTVRSGGLAGEDINGTITATGDIDLIDAGNAIIQATVTAGAATSSSPLATFISNEVSFAVWAFETGSTTTVDSGVTAQIVFDGTPTATLSISKLADSTPGTTPDIYITTRVDTSAEQLFTDTDVSLVDDTAANVNVTVGADAPITVGLLDIEGNYTLGGDTDITATTIEVEGGVSGTVNVPVTENIAYGQISGNLTINVAGSGTAGYLNIRGLSGTAIAAGATVTVNGSLAGINLGDASLGSSGSVGADAAVNATGSIGDITVQSDVNGSITGTSLGNITILGNFGNAFGSPLQILASTGNIGDIEVAGSIGADNDAGDTVTIQSTAGSIGLISAGGAIGAGNGTTSVVADQNIGGVQSDVTVGDTATAVTITATNGTIGTVSAAGDDGANIGINATITAGGNITAVTATDPDEDDGGIKGSILSSSGNIGTVSTIAADMAATVTATLGNIDNVLINPEAGDADGIVDDGTVSGNITAGGDIDAVAGEDITATIIAKAATASSPVLVVTDNGVVYTVDATSGPSYGLNYVGGTQTIDITIDNSTAAASSIDLGLTTTAAVTEALSAASFDLNSLNFTAGSTTQALGTLTVEGDVSLVETGSISALIVEGDVLVPVLVNSSDATHAVQAVSVGSAMGVDDPTAAQLAGLFEDPDVGDSVVIAAPADGTIYTLPAGGSSAGDDISFAFGTAGGAFNTPILLTDGGSAAEYAVTVSGGVITQIESSQASNGDVTIDGDLDYVLVAIDLDDVTITGSITATGGITANDLGDLLVGTAASSFNSYGSAAAAQTALDATGNMAGTIAISDPGDGLGTGLDGDIDSVTILGDMTGSISASGTVGAVSIGQSVADNSGNKVAQSGDMTGTLSVGENLTSLTAELDVVGSAGEGTSYICVAGNSGTITSTEGDIGGSGLIMVGGSLTTITAPCGAVSADIFIGGASGGGDAVSITGVGITGDLAIGAVNGVDYLSLTVKADGMDTNPMAYTISNTDNAGMLVEIEAGDVSGSGADVSTITLLEDSAALTLASSTGANINVDEILVIENNTAALAVTVAGDVGIIAAADGNAEVETSAAVQAAFNADNGTSCSVVNAPTALDNAINDDGNIALTLTGSMDNLDGVLATGALDVTLSDMDSVGFMLSLNSSVDADIRVNEDIGDIAASDDVTATLWTENGSVAMGGGTAMQAAVADYGLSGLPSWFDGGILTEIGDIVELDVNAAPEGLVVQGVYISDSSSGALGMLYSLTGDIEAYMLLGGDWEGAQAPIGDLDIEVYMPYECNIEMIIAPQTGGESCIDGEYPEPQLLLVDGEILVTANTPYHESNSQVEVSVTGSGTLGWLDFSGSSTMPDMFLVNGLAAGATVTVVDLDIDTLTVDGDWAGVVTVMTSGTTGPVYGFVDHIVVEGDIYADTADLRVDNFWSHTLFGEVMYGEGSDTQFGTGTLDSSDPSVTFINPAGDYQTLYLGGSPLVSAEYEMFFGKPTNVELIGRGLASLASVNAGSSPSYSELRSLISGVSRGDIPDGGNAHVGDISSNDFGSNIIINGVLIDGDADYVDIDGMAMGVAVTGYCYDLDVSRMINNCYIGGGASSIETNTAIGLTVGSSVDSEFVAIMAINSHFQGDVEEMSGNMFINVSVDSQVDMLNMGFGATGGAAYGRGGWGLPGMLINCRFGTVYDDNIDNRPWIENADPEDEGSDGVQFNMNPFYNPVTIIQTVAPGLTPFGPSNFDPDDSDDLLLTMGDN